MPARQIGAASHPQRHLVLDTSLAGLNVVIDGIRRVARDDLSVRSVHGRRREDRDARAARTRLCRWKDSHVARHRCGL